MDDWNKDELPLNPLPGSQNIPKSLKTWGNERTMNLNTLVLSNIQNSPYFKNELSSITDVEDLIDQIYYKVEHLEPWEKGTRKSSGFAAMCGAVRGVGAGGVVSSAFCLLYKLFMLKPSGSQLRLLLDHPDSPYIRGIGFMFIRYCLPPEKIFQWFEPYLNDEEEIDPKAGGGRTLTIGCMLKNMLRDIEWYGTLFPRIPIQIQKTIDDNLDALEDKKRQPREKRKWHSHSPRQRSYREKEHKHRHRSRSKDRDRKHKDNRHRSPPSYRKMPLHD